VVVAGRVEDPNERFAAKRNTTTQHHMKRDRGGDMVAGRPRRPTDSWAAAEAAFKAATAKPPLDLPAKKPTLPGAKETISIRVDRDVLDFFQADGPGWQERINEALRKAAGK